MKALSIRQPWAWLIVSGHKPVENRTWSTKRRGRFLIHAAKGMRRLEYDQVRSMLTYPEFRGLGIVLPPYVDLARGGIVGIATLADCVKEHDSPFFSGPYGFVLKDAEPLPFRHCIGALGFFEVKEDAL